MYIPLPEALANMSGVSFPLGPFSMPNDVGAAILDPHEPQALTPVANKFSCQSFFRDRQERGKYQGASYSPVIPYFVYVPRLPSSHLYKTL